jgi:hypothetical protein
MVAPDLRHSRRSQAGFPLIGLSEFGQPPLSLPDYVIRHVSPQIWEHINLTGIYDWMRNPRPEGIFRPLRTAKEKLRIAA